VSSYEISHPNCHALPTAVGMARKDRMRKTRFTSLATLPQHRSGQVVPQNDSEEMIRLDPHPFDSAQGRLSSWGVKEPGLLRMDRGTNEE